MAKTSLLFVVLVGAQLYLFSLGATLWSLVLVCVSSAVLTRLLRVFVLDKWRYAVPADGSWWVVVTGTSSGFGQLGALRLASAGLNVVATVRKESDGQALLQRASSDAIRKRLHVVVMDVTSPPSIKKAKEDVEAKLKETKGHLVAVINNAGYSVSGRLEVIPIGMWKKQYDVNVFGVVAVTQAFFPLLHDAAKQGLSPRVVYLSSVVGDVAMAETAPYSSSKFAVQAIADSGRVEFARYGIKTVVIQPGAFKTEFFNRLIKDYLPKEGEEGQELIDEEMRLKAIEAFQVGGPALTAMASYFPPADPVADAFETRMPEPKMFVGYDVGLYYLLSAVPDEVSDFLRYILLNVIALPFVRNRLIEKAKNE